MIESRMEKLSEPKHKIKGKQGTLKGAKQNGGISHIDVLLVHLFPPFRLPDRNQASIFEIWWAFVSASVICKESEKELILKRGMSPCRGHHTETQRFTKDVALRRYRSQLCPSVHQTNCLRKK